MLTRLPGNLSLLTSLRRLEVPNQITNLQLRESLDFVAGLQQGAVFELRQDAIEHTWDVDSTFILSRAQHCLGTAPARGPVYLHW